jgi:hypothetical protein
VILTPFSLTDLTTRRESTVRALYERLNRSRFVLVRYLRSLLQTRSDTPSPQVCGTPASGKSTLAQLLADHIRNEEPTVDPIIIDGWLRSDVSWRSRVPGYNNKGPNTFIVNDAQLTYWDGGLWNNLLKPIITLNSPNRAILFAGYARPIGRVTTEGTPVYVPDRNRVSLHPVDHGDQIAPVGLFYTHTEFADFVERRHPSAHFEQDFLDYVFRVTAGHPGAVTDLLRIVTANDVSLRIKLGIH